MHVQGELRLRHIDIVLSFNFSVKLEIIFSVRAMLLRWDAVVFRAETVAAFENGQLLAVLSYICDQMTIRIH